MGSVTVELAARTTAGSASKVLSAARVTASPSGRVGSSARRSETEANVQTKPTEPASSNDFIFFSASTTEPVTQLVCEAGRAIVANAFDRLLLRIFRRRWQLDGLPEGTYAKGSLPPIRLSADVLACYPGVPSTKIILKRGTPWRCEENHT
ncbi:hypothetical protein DF3PA_220018 [Candidatus Defluviicoccus seviourii]|uniref:Uncharacterized protein n=1 Tax=Candidatus Defluviicoccus seviourii TaxID=2565273 RepID=A0A564WD89_9PROT|nr:hypothetical protein DF3PA_220018 [Candidatus Defluviicoccus seviourii]